MHRFNVSTLDYTYILIVTALVTVVCVSVCVRASMRKGMCVRVRTCVCDVCVCTYMCIPYSG